MSPHVMSRWYRAPEIILKEKEYGFASDNWSIGCILAEMMNFASDSFEKKTDERIVFQGVSCFPLSPCHEMKASRGSDYIID